MDPRAPRPAGPDLTEADLDALLEHSAWLRRLAARLARDEGEADDLVQRTWLAALRRRGPRARSGEVRGWLSRVLHNEARQSRRSEGRRRDHERLAADEGMAASPSAYALSADAEERLALQRELIQAVDALGEPARSAVLQRYFEGRSVVEIAARAGVPVRTVETRLRRARAELRERFDDRYGSRGAWLAAAVPIGSAETAGEAATSSLSSAAPATAVAASPLLLIAMKFKIAALAALVAAIGSLALWKLDDGASSPGRAGVEGREGDASADAVAAGQRAAAVAAERRSSGAEAGSEDADATGATSIAAPSVIGKVFDERGRPLANFDVEFEPPLDGTSGARSDRNGLVIIPDVQGAARIRPESDAYAVLFHRHIAGHLRENGLGPILAVAPAYRLEARVTDPSGSPIEGAAWTLQLPEHHRTRYADPLDLVEHVTWTGVSDAAGVLILDHIPALAACRLMVSAAGYLPAELLNLPLPGGPEAAKPYGIVLEPLDPELVVRGVVREPGGEAVVGAHVGLGLESVETGADGEFSFTLERDPQRRRGPQRLLAAAPGWRPVTYEPLSIANDADARAEEVARGGWPNWVELRFAERPLEISGVVLGPDGEPRAGTKVWITDPTAVGDSSDMVLVESIGTRGGFWRTAESDGSGRFRLQQLADRPYELRAIDAATLHVSEVTVVAAGAENAVLQLAPGVEVVELEVRVEDAVGDPIEGATVNLERPVLSVSVKGSSSARFEHARRDGGVTAADGVCSVGEVALQDGAKLFVYGPDLMWRHFNVLDLSGERDGGRYLVRCVVHRMCEVRVIDESPEDERAMGFTLLDRSGEPLLLTFALENGVAQQNSGALVDGRSRVFRVSGEAATLELRRRGEVLESRPIALDPEGLNELRRD